MGNPGIDVAGHLRRVRRWADISQRQLAASVGVTPAVVGRWETGGAMTVAMFEQVLALAGLKIMVVEDDDRPTPPMRSDAVRDAGGRRYPAHLDVLPTVTNEERWDRPQNDVFAPYRRRRDRLRQTLREIPSDHPTPTDVLQEKQIHFELQHMVRLERLRQLRQRATALGLNALEFVSCTCPVSCEESPACPSTCPCQCEPPTGLGRVSVAAGTDPPESFSPGW